MPLSGEMSGYLQDQESAAVVREVGETEPEAMGALERIVDVLQLSA